MKIGFLWLMISLLLLAGCAAPTAQISLPLAPTETTAPQPEASLTPTAEPTEAPTATPTTAPEPEWIAFIGQDGNLRLLDRISGESRDVTSDGTKPNFADGNTTINYRNPQWSSDGTLLAYQREVGQPVSDGYNYTFELWVYQPATGATQQLTVNQHTLGTAWRPGTHWLAFAVPFDEGYFTTRDQVDSAKAKGIWAINVDNGENTELVPPQNGFSLVNPQWSPDGRFLAFEEIAYYEGRGFFSYFDFETQKYVASQESIGFYDFSPDSQTLAYDTLTYTARGDERIFLRPLAQGEPRQFSPDYELGYAFFPRFSPSGEYIAYLAEIGGPESGQFTLFVQPVAGGEARPLGTYANGLYLSWLPDESGLIFAAGPYEARQVFEVLLADGASRVLAEGDAPALQPANP